MNQLILRIDGEIVKVWEVANFDAIPSPAEIKDEIELSTGITLPDDTDGFEEDGTLEEDIGLPDEEDTDTDGDDL